MLAISGITAYLQPTVGIPLFLAVGIFGWWLLVRAYRTGGALVHKDNSEYRNKVMALYKEMCSLRDGLLLENVTSDKSERCLELATETGNTNIIDDTRRFTLLLEEAQRNYNGMRSRKFYGADAVRANYLKISDRIISRVLSEVNKDDNKR